MSQTPESRSGARHSRAEESLWVDDSPGIEGSLRAEESPGIDESLRIQASLRAEESPGLGELCIDDEVSVDDVRLLEEQFAAESAWWEANLPGGLIGEGHMLDRDLVRAAAEVERFANGYLGRLDTLLDDVAQDHSALAMQAARLAASVERSRAWAVVSDELVLPDPRMTPGKRLEWVMRTFVVRSAPGCNWPSPPRPTWSRRAAPWCTSFHIPWTPWARGGSVTGTRR